MKSLFFYALIFVCISCSEPNPDILSFFTYKNSSGVKIEFKLYGNFYKTIMLPNGSDFKEEIKGPGILIPLRCDSLGIVFNSLKEVIYQWNDPSLSNPLNLGSYEMEKINRNHYRFSITITEEDYQKALEAYGYAID